MGQRIAGYFELKMNGSTLSARGDFTVNLGAPKREAVLGSRTVDGYTEKVQAPMIKGEITDFSDTHVNDDILLATDATVTIKAGNGKTYMLEEAWYSGDGEINVGTGTVQIEFTGVRGTEA